MSLYTPDIVIAPSFMHSSSGVQEAFIWLAFSEFQESYTERGGSQRPLAYEINLEIIYETKDILVFVFSTDQTRNDKQAISYPLYVSRILCGIHEIVMRTGTLGSSRLRWEGRTLPQDNMRFAYCFESLVQGGVEILQGYLENLGTANSAAAISVTPKQPTEMLGEWIIEFNKAP